MERPVARLHCSPATAALLRPSLERHGFACAAPQRAPEAPGAGDLEVVELPPGGAGGARALERAHGTDGPRLLLVGTPAELAADRHGAVAAASELLAAPVDPREADLRIARLARTRAGSPAPRPGPRIVGGSRRMADVRRQVELVARTGAAVLIAGAPGTGRELVARAIHHASARRDAPFLAVPAACLPGPEAHGRIDLLEAAAGGTLYLADVEALPGELQERLLEGLERPPGPGPAARLVAGTSGAIEERVRHGTFREDLYYRIHGLTIALPALAERLEDVPELVAHFIERTAAELGTRPAVVAPGALDRLLRHDWPGNVRELQRVVVELLLAGERVIRGASLDRLHADGPLPAFRDAKRTAVERFERAYLERALALAGGNISAAARLSGKDRKDFWSLLRKHRIEPGRPRSAAARRSGAGDALHPNPYGEKPLVPSH